MKEVLEEIQIIYASLNLMGEKLQSSINVLGKIKGNEKAVEETKTYLEKVTSLKDHYFNLSENAGRSRGGAKNGIISNRPINE
jgi:hypothetical protein